MHVQFLNTQSKYSLQTYKARLTEALASAWDAVPASKDRILKPLETELSLSFVGPRQMKKLNAETRQIDETTDVLSFPLHEFLEGKAPKAFAPGDIYPATEQSEFGDNSEEEIGKMAIQLGDIVLCPERAATQAQEYGHSFEREILFLAVHGFLHLLGYDHLDNTSERKMRKLQSSIMDKIGATVVATPIRANGSAAEEKNNAPNAEEPIKSGFIAIVGRPNAGKSTLLNQLSGEYLAITSHKAQTTRNNIRCIIDSPEAQCIFIDTPGLHSPKHQLGNFMMEGVHTAVDDSDLLLLILDANKRVLSKEESTLVARANAMGKPVILALNKIDSVEKISLLPLIERLSKRGDFQAIVPISALKGDGSKILMQEIITALPFGPRYYSADDYTDQTERQLAAELIREQILRFTNQEIPHGTGVIITSFDERWEDGAEDEYARQLVKIKADILCERESHKIILIGKQGTMLKRIGSSARIAIEQMLDCKVYLELFVKVRPDWRNRPSILSDLGYQMPKDDKKQRKKK